MSETMYYEDPLVLIDSESLILSGRAYHMADVRDVTTRTVRSDFGSWKLYASLTPLLFMIFGQFRHADNPIYLSFTYLLLLLTASVFLYALYFDITKPRNQIFLIILEGAFGQVIAFASLDMNYISSIVEAIRNSLSEKVVAKPASPIPNITPMQNVHIVAKTPPHAGRVLTITGTEASINNHNYNLSAIKSCRSLPIQIDKIDEWLFILGTVGWGIWGIFTFPIWESTSYGYSDPNHALFDLVALAGVLLSFIVAIKRYMRKPVQPFLVELRGTFGRVNAFVSMDGELVKRIVERVKEARKGQAPGISTTPGTPA